MKYWKEYAVAGLIAVVMTVGYACYQEQINAAEQRGAANEMAMRAELWLQRYRDYKIATDPQLDTLRAENQRLESALDTSMSDLTLAERRADSLDVRARELIAALPDSVGNDVTAALDAAQAEANQCSLVLKNCTELVAGKDSVVAYQNVRLVKADTLITLQASTIERLKAVQRRPSLLPWGIAIVSVSLLALSLIL